MIWMHVNAFPKCVFLYKCKNGEFSCCYMHFGICFCSLKTHFSLANEMVNHKWQFLIRMHVLKHMLLTFHFAFSSKRLWSGDFLWEYMNIKHVFAHLKCVLRAEWRFWKKMHIFLNMLCIPRNTLWLKNVIFLLDGDF